MSGKHYNFCPLVASCDWNEVFDTKQGAQLCGVLHLLDKHPEEYRRVTGRDPDQARRLYADELRYFHRKL